MKTITLKLNKQFDEDYDVEKEEDIDNILNSLTQCEFKFTDDNTGSYLRFVEIESDNVDIEIFDLGIALRNKLKPHLFTIIRATYLWNIEIKL